MRRWLGSWSRPCSRDMVLFVTMVLWLLSMWLPSGQTMLSQQERLQLREETREMFYHSFSSYMKYAYPLDELMPLSCKGRDWRNKERGTLDDVLGGYALTLIDSLDMLAVLGDFDRFYDGVQLVIRDVSFERNVTVSVFEATIRLLGGLLSAHSLLEAEELEPVFRDREPRYEGELLDLAYDLGMRLLPAFDTRTGIPVHRVNLLVGVPLNETRETCVAAAGTLILEFGLLSRLTGDHRFERAARRALKALWDRRSSINLVGSTIHTQTGRWLQTHTGVGAGVDSWYEYLLKGAILFGDEELLDWFQTAYAAVQDHTLWGSWNVEVSMAKGKWQPHSFRVSALQAFWPSVQVLAGELTAAKASHRAFYSLWREFRALPEIFDARGRQLIHFARDSPLRPEFVESTYHLYLATRDPHYLNVGKEVLFSLQNLSRVGCGFAAIADVSSSPLRLDDRMDSFFLAETLKYLYLLFDQSLEPAKQSSLFCPWGPPTDASHDGPTTSKVHVTNATSPGSPGVGGGGPSSACLPLVRTIFTTEGHIFLVQDQADGTRARHKRKGSKARSKLGSVTQNVVNEVTQKKAQSSGAGSGGAGGGSGSLKSTPVPSAVAPSQWASTGGSNMPHVTGTRARKAAQAAAVPKALPKDYRQCSAPSVGGDEAGAAAAEDSPVDTLEQEVVKAMQYMEPMPPTALGTDSTDVQVSPELVVQCDEGARCRVGRIARSPAKVVLSIRQLGGSKGPLSDSKPMETALVGYPANFGPDLRRMGMVTAWLHAPFHRVVETPITRRRFYACERFSPEEAEEMRGSVVVVMRGVCSFVEKVRHLQHAGAAGVLILDFNPPPGADNDDGGSRTVDGGDADSLESLYLSWQVMADDGSGSDIDIPAALLTGRSARTVKRLLDRSDRLQRSSDGTYKVMVTMSPDAEALTVVEEEDMRDVGVTAKGGYSGYQFTDVNVGEGFDSVLRNMLESLFSRAGFRGAAQGAPGVGHGAHAPQEQFTAERRRREGAAPSGADREEGQQGNAFSSDASRPRRGKSARA